jgi:hypothetical protein
MDLSNAVTFNDTIEHCYYVAQGGVAVVQNMENGAWYTYRNFPAQCMIVYRDALYIGTEEGTIRHVSRAYTGDDGEAIAAYWESGAMDFGLSSGGKVSPDIYVTMKPEPGAHVLVSVRSDVQGDCGEESIGAEQETPAQPVSAGLMTFRALSFSHLSFGTSRLPRVRRLKLRAKRFAFYRLIFRSDTNWSAATILGADIRVRYTGAIR